MQYQDYLISLGLSHRTIRTYALYLKRAQVWASEKGVDLLDLTPSQARELGETFPLTNPSRRPLRVALRHYWTMHGVVGPEGAIYVPKRPRGKYRGIADTDVARLLSLARTDWPRGGVIYVGIYQGLRRENIARLRWDEFDANLDWLSIVAKGGAPHSMPVHPAVKRVLKPHRWPGEYVFPGRFGGHVSLATVNNWVESITAEAGVRITPHQMRHTAGGKVYRMTGDIKLAAAWLGHAHLSTTQIYTEVTDEQLVEAVEVLDWEDDADWEAA